MIHAWWGGGWGVMRLGSITKGHSHKPKKGQVTPDGDMKTALIMLAVLGGAIMIQQYWIASGVVLVALVLYGKGGGK